MSYTGHEETSTAAHMPCTINLPSEIVTIYYLDDTSRPPLTAKNSTKILREIHLFRPRKDPIPCIGKTPY